MKLRKARLLAIFLAVAISVTFIPTFSFAATSLKAPAKVKATVVSDTAVQVSWGKVKGAKGYLVYQKQADSKYKLAKKIKKGATVKWVSNNLTTGEKYSFKIKAFKGKKKSKFSKEVSAIPSPPAASIFMNGKVYTVEGEDWENNAVEAMAVDAEGKLLGVGSTAEITAQFKGDNTEVVDLGGKTVFPGFIDSHIHPPGPAFTVLYEISLSGIFTKEETLSVIKDFVDSHPDMDAYFGFGYSNAVTDKDGNVEAVNRAWLDEICPDKPIVLSSFDYHSRWLNTTALEMCGITKDTLAPEGGDIKKDLDGELTGVLTDCSGLVTLEAEYTAEQINEAWKWFFERMNSWGYTGYSDAGTSSGYADMLMEKSKAENGLPVRINFAGMMSPDDIDGSIARLDALKEKVGDTKDIRVTTAKIFADGVVEGGTAYLWEPYKQPALQNLFGKEETNWTGAIKLSQEQLNELALKANAKGYPIHVHSIGDRATTMTLDAIEYAQTELAKEGVKDECRNIITHLQVVDQDDIQRFKELGVIAACQVFWHFKAPDMYWPIEEPLLGKARAAREYPLNSFYRIGVPITASGDYPISPVNNPFWAIEIGVTRNLENAEFYKGSFPDIKDIEDMDEKTYLLNPAERVPLKAMIEAYTINGAYQMNYEDVCGSLKAGKVADFVVCDTDPFEINPVKIDEVKVLKTYKDGKIVWEE